MIEPHIAAGQPVAEIMVMSVCVLFARFMSRGKHGELDLTEGYFDPDKYAIQAGMLANARARE